jgi:hypothetical protein
VDSKEINRVLRSTKPTTSGTSVIRGDHVADITNEMESYEKAMLCTLSSFFKLVSQRVLERHWPRCW